jgi:hypothetical protein
MANGTAVRVAPITPELPAAAQPFDPQLGGAEGWIDAIVIALADMSAQACAEIQAGELTATTRRHGGDLLGRLVVLRSMVGDTFLSTPCAGSADVQCARARL